MGKAGRLKMGKRERHTSANCHLINLTGSQVERKNGKGAHTPHTHKEREREEELNRKIKWNV